MKYLIVSLIFFILTMSSCDSSLCKNEIDIRYLQRDTTDIFSPTELRSIKYVDLTDSRFGLSYTDKDYETMSNDTLYVHARIKGQCILVKKRFEIDQ